MKALRTIVQIAVATLLAGCPGADAVSECPRVDGLTRAQCDALPTFEMKQMPPSWGNAKADDPDAALLGFAVFFDARMSRDQTVRCASCHVPERYFADGRPTAVGIDGHVAPRNSPSIHTAPWHRWQMWDGLADSLWSQAALPFENPKEMDLTRLELAERIGSLHREGYEGIFGALPDMTGWPARGRPGDEAFDQLEPATQHEVNRIMANVGKALEAYERRVAWRHGRFDAFVTGDDAALSDEERRGFAVFMKSGCDACHSGPALSDDGFHRIGLPPAAGAQPERARAAALEALPASPFSSQGPFYDGEAPGPLPTPVAADEGAYRTPSLRSVGRTGPWGHNGTFERLGDIVDFHLKGGEGDVDEKLKPVSLSADERAALLAFLLALDPEDPPSPWNNWPDR